REETGDRETTAQQRQPGPNPGQERALVREREPVVRRTADASRVRVEPPTHHREHALNITAAWRVRVEALRPSVDRRDFAHHGSVSRPTLPMGNISRVVDS